MNAFKVTFEDVKPIWEQELWPNRKSAIEPMSVMTWPFEGDPEEYDMNIMEKYEPTFICLEICDYNITGIRSPFCKYYLQSIIELKKYFA